MNWFEKFITALTESAEGTGSAHTDLVRALKREKAKRERVPNPPAQDDQFKPSRIANLTGAFVVQSNLSHLQAARTDLVSPVSPSILRKQEATDQKIVDLEKKQLALENQIRLVFLNESLIKHMKLFRDSLINVQSLYVNRFRNDKIDKRTLLSKEQVQMAKIIENLTGCDENFDLVKEIEVWNKTLKLMEENYDKMKEVLFSLDESQIKQQQSQLKLEGEAKGKASRWIAERENVVENAIAYSDELIKLIDVNAESDHDLVGYVQKRIDAGKECLDLWKKWVQLTASL